LSAEGTGEGSGARPRLVLGLGNPGPSYAGTRHNLGFRVVDALAERLGAAVDRLECNALVGAAEIDTGALLLAKPLTWMNRSGHAAHCLAECHGTAPAGVLVVYDEVGLPLGRLRLRAAGGPGGHRGVESVIAALRTDEVPRLRLGIAPDGEAPAGEVLADWVLAPFEPDEEQGAEEMVERAADACRSWLDDGIEAAMTHFNQG
jgi:PTH1 family peptidyl-tRNA hydrolase